jgi:hypothetical protein
MYTVAVVYGSYTLGYNCRTYTTGQLYEAILRSWPHVHHSCAAMPRLGKVQCVGVHSTSHLDYGPIVVCTLEAHI